MFSLCELAMQAKSDKYKDADGYYHPSCYVQYGILVWVPEQCEFSKDIFYWISTEPFSWVRSVDVRI
jgi:hypothetical protein